MALTIEQRARYERNLLIPSLGESGQERLARARVLIVGLGGLGSPASLYLAAAGVGYLGLMDSDVIELSNLQRQVLHSTPRLGCSKTQSATETLSALNPQVKLETYHLRLTGDTATETFSRFDVIIEASDNFETKFLVNDTCLHLKKPFATAGILALSGQAQFVVPGRTPCLRCVLPDIPAGVPTTAELGVLGAVPGILGSLQAMEAIRWLTGVWKPQSDGRGQVHSVDGDLMRLRTMVIPRRVDCACASLWSN